MKKKVFISILVIVVISIAGVISYKMLDKPATTRSGKVDTQIAETAEKSGATGNKDNAPATESLISANASANATAASTVVSDSQSSENTNQEDIEKAINDKLYSLTHQFLASSNPYDYIKDNKDFEYIIAQGDKALEIMLQKFEKTNKNGLEEYIMAIACSKILGEKEENKTWASGMEWYNQYTKNKK